MIPILGVPILNRGDLLLRLIQSIDYPVENLIIIDNSNGKDQSVTHAVGNIITNLEPNRPNILNTTVVQPTENLGVAGSWNKIMTYPADYWLIVGNDIMFNRGELEKIDTFVQANKHDHAIMFGLGHNVFAVTPYGLDNVGTFDENFYPAYLEDCDHFYRVKLAGVKSANIPNVAPIHGEAPSWGSSTIYSNDRWRELNGITHGNNFKYYRAKWGGKNGEEKYKHPLDDPTINIKTWELDPGHRTRNNIWI
jgi:GT2 family glycosyltransferase